MGLGQKSDFPQIMEPQKDEPTQPHTHSCPQSPDGWKWPEEFPTLS